MKARHRFPTMRQYFKLLYLAVRNIAKKWAMPVHDWNLRPKASPSSTKTDCRWTKLGDD
jgi:transposase-like protein